MRPQAVTERMAPLGLPFGLLLLGALIGLQATLNAPLAWERIAGIVLGFLAGLLALWRVPRTSDRFLPAWLVVLAALATLHGLWQVAASGPDIFRGPIGLVLQRVFASLLGAVPTTDAVELTNTRYIWGLAGVALIPIFLGGAALLARPTRRLRGAAWGLVGLNLVLLLGTGQRGALVGLAVGATVGASYLWRWWWLPVAAAVPALLLLAVLGVLDKGLDLSSTIGRVYLWQDSLRLLAEFPISGVGLGMDTANRVLVAYELNPDPERVFYVHNTFVQGYLETGLFGFLGLVLLLVLPLAVALLSRTAALSVERRALVVGAASLTAAMQTHGLTDQVVPTTVGTLVLGALAGAIFAVAPDYVMRRFQRLTLRASAGLGVLVLFGVTVFAIIPPARIAALVNLGGVQANQLLLQPGPLDERKLAEAESALAGVLRMDPSHPAALRTLARLRAARFDYAQAVELLDRAASSPKTDAFDRLQVAHLYRNLGFGDEAWLQAQAAYSSWGRAPPMWVDLAYSQATLPDDFRVRTLATQGEAAIRARDYEQAVQLFAQALQLAPEPKSPYLVARLAGSQRGLERERQRAAG